MAHKRPRYAEKQIKKALSHSPIIGILGHRQVGKTTLATQLCQEYVTFDSTPRLAQATSQPMEFLENRKKPFAVDEAQLCPPLFPAAKEWVRVHPEKGQIILTGSVRFTSRKLIRESLTGRISNIEILPMTMSEMTGEPLTSHLSRVMDLNSPSKLGSLVKANAKKKAEPFLRHLETGGLPGISFFRDPSVRHDRFESHLDTLLNRDLRLILSTTVSALQLRKFASFLAETQGTPLEFKEAGSAGQISTPTVKKLLFAFEALFLIRPITSEGSVSKISYFFEDQGLASHLSKNPPPEQDKILRGIYTNLRQELHYRPHPRNEIFSFRTHDGTEVPLAFKFDRGIIGIIPSDERVPTLKAQASAKSFLSAYPDAKVIIACRAPTVETRDFKVFVIPYWQLC